ncbi:hypothetical protein [Enteractinococcus helveticum]
MLAALALLGTGTFLVARRRAQR